MNNLIAILLLAFTATLAVSQPPTDESRAELASVVGNKNKLFNDYCLFARQVIKNAVEDHVSEASSQFFKALLGSAAEITKEILDVNMESVKRLSESLKNPDEATVSEGLLSEDAVLASIEQGKNEIAQKDQATGAFGRLVCAVKTGASVLIQVADSSTTLRLAKLRAKLSGTNFARGLAMACRQVGDYEYKLQMSFNDYKGDLLESTQEMELKNFIENAEFVKLECATPKIISRASAFCDLLKNASEFAARLVQMDGKEFQRIMNAQEAIEEETSQEVIREQV